MSDDELKFNLLSEIWIMFTGIESVLLEVGINEKRMPKNAKLLEALDDIPLNKMRHGKGWLANFIKTHIEPYRKIRKENTEEYWAQAKALGWGNEYTEIRVLNGCAKRIKGDWFCSHNPLILPKKPKPEKKDD